MDKGREVFRQADAFLQIAASAKNPIIPQAKESKEVMEIGGLLVQITHIQRELAKAKLDKQRRALNERFPGMTELSWLLSSFNQQADNLSQLLGSCGKLQLQLSRPAVTNSLPCPATLQASLVTLTKSLGEVAAQAEASLAALQWVGNQAWEEVGEKTNQSASLLDKAAARLRAEIVAMQGFRESLVVLLEGQGA